MNLLRKLSCTIGACPFKTNSDEHGVWGECTRCGKRAGYVTREQIRRYVEAEEAARAEARKRGDYA